MCAAPHRPIQAASTVRPSPDQVARDLDGEIIILNLATGTYYGLEAVGARVWELIHEQPTVRQLRDSLLAEFDVAADQCETDLLRLLGELQDRGLIEIEEAAE